jgi:hypothetical protein
MHTHVYPEKIKVTAQANPQISGVRFLDSDAIAYVWFRDRDQIQGLADQLIELLANLDEAEEEAP